jgi:hypothetical protein
MRLALARVGNVSVSVSVNVRHHRSLLGEDTIYVPRLAEIPTDMARICQVRSSPIFNKNRAALA